MKVMLAKLYAYQRLDHDEIINQALKGIDEFPWQVPDYVPVIYNGVFGDQRCKNVNGFPNPPPGQGILCPKQKGGSGGTVGPDDDSTGKEFPEAILSKAPAMAWG
ncbi:hypothetical protein INS49_006721 [Diaporthe citri]|uniref:uncharacterized protein n=1 Tax=Diaporthe citri TaxID=83186 RepID=UPI001C816FDF|nr:uncharacterized protein INS49_006721 [Diaporthe citri]KAG6365114.1 hypothetical protein INS49_006721 [Diaporthe citri]